MTLTLFWSNFNVLLDRIAAVGPLNKKYKSSRSPWVHSWTLWTKNGLCVSNIRPEKEGRRKQ